MDNQLLPLFPLRLVVFPNEELNLHIFEPRYRQLIEECDQEAITFGIPPYINNSLKPIGTEMKLIRIEKKYPDGKMDVRTRAKGLFRMQRFLKNYPGKLYAGAEIEWLEYTAEGDPVQEQKLIALAVELFTILNIEKRIPLEQKPLSYVVAHHLGLLLEQEYELLTIENEKDRQAYLLNHLETVIPIAREMEALKEKIKMNGHFQNIIPPEI
jgi:hypothetical protein